MTEKQLREDIILKMLDYRDQNYISIDEFCKTKNITFSSDEQKERIFHYLNDNGYIHAEFLIGGDGIFNITSEGIDYAERLLAQSLTETTELVKNHKVEIDDNFVEPTHSDSTQKIVVQLYSAIENKKKIIDNSVEACFNVEKLAKCYVKLIDRSCENEQNNVCLFGIFAPWGRGKTYFFKKIKEYINGRKNSKAMQYDIVEFNAWKYQETPAVWAYLFETLYNSKSWWFKFRYTIKRNIKSIGCDVLIYFIPTILTAIATLITKCEPNKDNMFIGTSIVGIISIIGLIINFISKHYNSARSLILKYTKGISFAKELGMQAEIEKEITSLLKFWISKKKTVNKKVILYIDDIDRCSETKMTSIIDSLRTVLENAEIRKRLIIICSIDPDKIIKGIEYKYNNLYDNKQIHSIAIDQMDKIFLTGIALPPLSNEQLLEYALKLTKADNKKNQETNPESQSSKNNDENKDDSIENKNNSIEPEDDTKESKGTIDLKLELSDREIYNQLEILIKNNKKQLTPRKIRIIYDRILLANNIICNKEYSIITKTLINNIFNLSVGNKIEKSDKDDELTDILNMVVPYRYNEEDEVTSKVTQG